MSGTMVHYIKQHKHFLKLSFSIYNVINVTCNDMDKFNITSKDFTLVKFYSFMSSVHSCSCTAVSAKWEIFAKYLIFCNLFLEHLSKRNISKI